MTVSHTVDFGAYLTCEDLPKPILLPAKYISAPVNPGDEIDVFVYTDSADRLIATTLSPKAMTDQVALLTVKASDKVGTFLDWGLEKDLLLPYSEQKRKLRPGQSCLVYVYLDHASQRIAASAKLEHYIGNAYPEYRPFAKVEAIITERHELGYKAVVDNRHWGMIYADQTHRPLSYGDRLTAYVRKIRPDGRLDLTLLAPAAERIRYTANMILARLKQTGGSAPLGDHTDPQYISASFGCSKKDFKKAIGLLLKERTVVKTDEGLALFEGNEA